MAGNCCNLFPFHPFFLSAQGQLLRFNYLGAAYVWLGKCPLKTKKTAPSLLLLLEDLIPFLYKGTFKQL